METEVVVRKCADCPPGPARCKPCGRSYQERRRKGEVAPRRGPWTDEETREYFRQYYQRNREHARDQDRQRRYGLLPGQYEQMRTAQDDRCAICGCPESKVVNGRLLALGVDHCHLTGAVRGLLCTGCNVGLGAFSDDLPRLRAAIEYLESHG